MEISPKAIAEAFEAIHSTIQQTGTWKDDTWECLVDTTIKKDVVKAWRQLDAASGLYKFRVYGVLSQIQLDRFVEFYSDYEYRSTWDPYTASLEVVESTVTDTVTRHALLWRVKFGVPLVSDREYLFTRVSEKQGDVWVMVDQQWASPQFPEKKSVTRVAGYNCGICLKQETNGADEPCVVLWMDYLTAVDLKMSIPKFLVNWAATSGVKSVISSFHDAYDKYSAYQTKKKLTTK